jgi:hypothetical protein
MTGHQATTVLADLFDTFAEKGEPIKLSNDEDGEYAVIIEDVTAGLNTDGTGEITLSVYHEEKGGELIHLHIGVQP